MDHDRASAAVVEKIGVVLRREQRRERHGHGTDAHRAQERGDELGRVRKEKGDPLLCLDPEAGETGGDTRDELGDVAVRERASLVPQRRTRAATGREMRVEERRGEVEHRRSRG